MKVIVLYACFKLIEPVPCVVPPGSDWQIEEDKWSTTMSTTDCHDEPLVQHEFRSRVVYNVYCKGYERPPFTDDDGWTCTPIAETEVPE